MTTTDDRSNSIPDDDARWRETTLARSVERFPVRKHRFSTLSGIEIRDLYTATDIDTEDAGVIGHPGEYPFTRGVHPTMYRARPWTIRQVAGFGQAEDTNRRYRYLLDHGETGLSTDFDLPTLLGRDSDHPIARAEVGKIGVAVDTLVDVRELMAGIPLDEVSTSYTINASAFILIAMYEAVAREQGVADHLITGTCQNDILKEYTAQNEFIYPPAASMRLVVDTMEYASTTMPSYNPVSVSGYHIREAGATAVEEVAFTLAAGHAYASAAVERGIPVDSVARRISFFFDIHNDFFEEIAKLRAARRLWARIMRKWLRCEDEKSWLMRTHCQTAGVSLTAQQPHNNIARTAIQALAGVLGGTQSLHTNSMDEAFQVPSEEAIKIAVRTQQLLLLENRVGDVVDPLAGSYYVESLTNEIEAAAEDLIVTVLDRGGMVASIEDGFVQRRIADSAAEYQADLESGDEHMIGINVFNDDEEGELPFSDFVVDPGVSDRQIARLEQVRRERDGTHVTRLLHEFEQAARGDTNLMPLVSELVKAHASVGEICDVLRGVFGEYKPLSIY